MRRLGTLVIAILVITGCSAMQPNIEETELLWAVTEKNIQKWAITTKTEANSAEKPRNTPETTVEIPQKTPELVEELTPQPSTATPEPPTNEYESQFQHEPPTPQQTEQPEEILVIIDWPLPLPAHRSQRLNQTGPTSPPRSCPHTRPNLNQRSSRKSNLHQRPSRLSLTSLLTLFQNRWNRQPTPCLCCQINSPPPVTPNAPAEPD